MAQQNQRSEALKDYITVAERVDQFYERFPDGRILTQIIEHDQQAGFILMRAEVYRTPDEAVPAATGHAFEVRSEGHVQRTSYVEVCETSCVGRAIALCGFNVKRGPSRTEMEKVQRMEKPLKAVPNNPRQSQNSEWSEAGVWRSGHQSKRRIVDLEAATGRPASELRKQYQDKNKTASVWTLTVAELTPYAEWLKAQAG
jgi:hypothetical protein